MTRWARYRSQDGRVGFGVVEGTRIAEYEGDMFAAPRPTGAMLERSAVMLESPCRPSKIVALWTNFHALAAKLGKQPPPRPLYLIKAGTSVIGPDAPIERPKSYPGKIVYEGELGVVIGRRCKDVEVGDAAGYVFGYTCVNDVTAAEVLTENGDFVQWCRSKSYDTFGCLGPVIATNVDLSRVRILTLLDGVERQNYPLSDIIFAPLALVSHISRDMTLLPGDVIACGTSVGVGSIREGSTVEVRIDGIGALTNTLAPR